MSLRPQGKEGIQKERITSQRTAFAPALVRYANLAPQTASAWSSASGTATITTGISAPDSTTSAATLSTTSPPSNYRRIYSAETTINVGDTLIAGVWVKAGSLSQGANQADGTMEGYAAATLRVIDNTEGYAFDIDGFNYRNLISIAAADTQWEWIATNVKIESAPSGNSATLAFDLNCDTEHSISFYAPLLWRIPTGSLTDDDIDSLMLGLYSVPDQAQSGIIATLKSQSFQSKLRDAGGRHLDVRTRGAVCDGVTDDTAAIQAALNETQGTGVPVLIPANVAVTQLVIGDDMHLMGAGPYQSTILALSNVPTITVSSTAYRSSLRSFRIQGDRSLSSQVGIKLGGMGYYHSIWLEDIAIEYCGSHGLEATQIYSSAIEKVRSSFCVGYPFLIDAPARPNIVLRDCYASIVLSSAPVGFRIKAGAQIRLENCNGIDGIDSAVNGLDWARVGRKNGEDGDTTDEACFVQFVSCNFESWLTRAVRFLSGSAGTFEACIFAGDASTNGSKIPIEYEAGTGGAYPAFASFGSIDDRSAFTDGPLSNYANNEAIHCNDIPPLLLTGRGPSVAGSGDVPLGTYYDSGTTQTEYLFNAGDFQPIITVTGSRSFARPGPKYIEVNHSAPATITLPYPTWYKRNQFIVVKDVSSTGAATNNITINSNAGSTVNGAGSYVISVNKGAAIFAPNATADDWRVVGFYGSATGANQALSNLSSVAINTSLLPASSNTIDLGDASHVWRTGYFGTKLLLADGSASAPVLARAAATGTGIYFDSYVNFAVAGTQEGLIAGQNFQFGLGVDETHIFDLSVSSKASNKPRIRYDGGTSKWQISNNGTAFSDIPTSGGSPGGSDTQLQRNNAGAFGGISGATSNGTNVTFTGGNLIATSPKFTTDISDSNGNELFKLTATASAVNEFTVANAAASSAAGPTLSATGSDTNIPITLLSKGTGQVLIGYSGSTSIPALSWTGSTGYGVSAFNSGLQFHAAGTNAGAISSNGFKTFNTGRYEFSSDSTTSGTSDLLLFRFAANTLRVGGNAAGNTPGKLIVGRSDDNLTGAFSAFNETATTNAIVDSFRLGVNSSSTPAANFGGRLSLTAHTTTTKDQTAATLDWQWTTATHASRSSDLIISTVNAATLGEAGRFTSAGDLTIARRLKAAYLAGSGSAGTGSTGTGAGTGPSLSVFDTQLATSVALTTGTGTPAANAKIFDITFSINAPTYYQAFMVPANAAAAALTGNQKPFVDDASAANNKVTIKSGSTGLAASTSYIWYLLVVAV